MKTYIAQEGDTADLIAFRYYGKTAGKVVETMLAANPGLCDLGAIIPAGTEVLLPEIDTTAKVQGVRLWD